MTISSSARQTSEFTGPQAAGHEYAFSFRLHDSSMLEVVVRTDGGSPVASSPSNYTVSLNVDQYSNPGGTVVFDLALASNETLQIRSNLTIQQQSDLSASASYKPRDVEDAVDYLTMCMQDIVRKAGI